MEIRKTFKYYRIDPIGQIGNRFKSTELWPTAGENAERLIARIRKIRDTYPSVQFKVFKVFTVEEEIVL